jgi:hypothetical protein
MSEDAARAAGAVVAKSHPEMLWLPVIGLDRSSPMIGLRPLSDMASSCESKYGLDQAVQDAIYQPISNPSPQTSARYEQWLRPAGLPE